MLKISSPADSSVRSRVLRREACETKPRTIPQNTFDVTCFSLDRRGQAYYDTAIDHRHASDSIAASAKLPARVYGTHRFDLHLSVLEPYRTGLVNLMSNFPM